MAIKSSVSERVLNRDSKLYFSPACWIYLFTPLMSKRILIRIFPSLFKSEKFKTNYPRGDAVKDDDDDEHRVY